MATQKRSSSGKRTTTGKKTTAGGKRTAAPKKRPIRREVGGVVCLVLALCIAFSYFQQGGWLLDQPRGAVPRTRRLRLLYGRARAAARELYPALPPRAERHRLRGGRGAAAGAARRDAPPRTVPDGVQQHDRCSKAPLEERACDANLAVYLLVLSKYCSKFW